MQKSYTHHLGGGRRLHFRQKGRGRWQISFEEVLQVAVISAHQDVPGLPYQQIDNTIAVNRAEQVPDQRCDVSATLQHSAPFTCLFTRGNVIMYIRVTVEALSEQDREDVEGEGRVNEINFEARDRRWSAMLMALRL